jgi:hypothetical protein
MHSIVGCDLPGSISPYNLIHGAILEKKITELYNLNCIDTLSTNTQISNFKNIRRGGAQMFIADRHDEANKRPSQFCEIA